MSWFWGRSFGDDHHREPGIVCCWNDLIDGKDQVERKKPTELHVTCYLTS